MNSVPEEIDNLDRRIRQLEIEKEAIKREGDQEKAKNLDKEIADLSDERNKRKAKWQEERNIIEQIQKNKGNIEQYKLEADRAEREGLYDQVAELRYGKIKEAEEEINRLQEELQKLQNEGSLIKEEVDGEDIAEVVARWTGIPVSRMLQSEREKLLHLEDNLHQRVVGQEEAITAVSDAIRRSRAGLQDPNRPIGSFIFMGTTGVGKTELAKALAEFMFDDENMMTRIDMSEYQERYSVSRLIGAPPGYVGYEEGGQLTESVRRKPYSVLLLDEIEKAHHDVFNILLQVLDDGRLTDNKGRTANFKNTIIIMTSNIGSHVIQKNMSGLNDENADQVFDQTRKEVMNLMQQSIRPEFLNRIDDIVMFKPLSKEELKQVVQLQFDHVRQLMGSNGNLQLTPELVDWVAQVGFDPQYGARPIRRVIQRNILNELSKKILEGKVSSDQKVTIDVRGDKVVFTN
jgi:ATP-dependent Clp protease ATP-binding subunit ClpB